MQLSSDTALAQTVSQQGELEIFCASMLTALYDDPIAFSLRDGDGTTGALEAVGPVRRFRLQCYAIENLLLTDECLSILGCDWGEFCKKATDWMAQNPNHEDLQQLKALVESADRLRHQKIKDIRQLVCAIAGSRKPWEFVVGQAIGKNHETTNAASEHKLAEYVGAQVLAELTTAAR